MKAARFEWQSVTVLDELKQALENIVLVQEIVRDLNVKINLILEQFPQMLQKKME